MINYLDCFILKYQNAGVLPTTGDVKKDAELLHMLSLYSNEGLSTELTPERLYIEGAVLGKPFELGSKFVISGAKVILPRTTAILSNALERLKSGINWVGNAVLNKPLERIRAYSRNPFSTQKPVLSVDELFTSEADFTMSEMANAARRKLINYYNSAEYRQRLLRSGFSDAQADARIKLLILNTNSAKIYTSKLADGAKGLTNITPWNLLDITIEIDVKNIANKAELESTILEELAHAGELSGITELSAREWMVSNSGSVDAFKLQFPEKYNKIILLFLSSQYKALNNPKSIGYNLSLGGNVDLNNIISLIYSELAPDLKHAFMLRWNKASVPERLNMAQTAAEYYNLPHEKRARALGRLFDEIDRTGYVPKAYRRAEASTILGKEFLNFYNNSSNYLDNFISLGAPVGFGYVGISKLNTNKDK